jgi:hypothetical protein
MRVRMRMRMRMYHPLVKTRGVSVSIQLCCSLSYIRKDWDSQQHRGAAREILMPNRTSTVYFVFCFSLLPSAPHCMLDLRGRSRLLALRGAYAEIRPHHK